LPLLLLLLLLLLLTITGLMLDTRSLLRSVDAAGTCVRLL
jgi:hypothetical protein